MISEIAKKEGIKERKLSRLVAEGKVVILKNSRREIEPVAIGKYMSVKINANVGTSPEIASLEKELEKAKIAVKYGSDTIMDLSIGGNLDEIRRTLLKKIDVPLGTVPIYQAFIEKKLDMDPDFILKIIEKHCKDGVDFLTLHCGITRDIVERIATRLIPITSRGGSFIASWIIEHKEENPLLTHFSEILEIVKEYEATISLGDALRPGCLKDSSDVFQIQELLTLGKLVKIARKEGAKVIVEGPGHVPLNEIEMNMKLEKKICDEAPFYVLGPLVTDIALGYDHISAAIGGAIAAIHGADFLCYVTPSEHLGLPDVTDVKQGVIAAKIAAHAANIVRKGYLDRDTLLSKYRRELNWDKVFELSIDPEIKKKYPSLKDRKECTMCGKYCAIKIVDNYLKKVKK